MQHFLIAAELVEYFQTKFPFEHLQLCLEGWDGWKTLAEGMDPCSTVSCVGSLDCAE